jgi:hypothetical protein
MYTTGDEEIHKEEKTVAFPGLRHKAAFFFTHQHTPSCINRALYMT